MSKAIKQIPTPSGGTINSYGCATVLEAVDLVGAIVPSGDVGSKIITVDQCLSDPNPYGVTISDTPIIDYTNGQGVAYADLVPYIAKGKINKASNSKLGCLIMNGQDVLAEGGGECFAVSGVYREQLSTPTIITEEDSIQVTATATYTRTLGDGFEAYFQSVNNCNSRVLKINGLTSANLPITVSLTHEAHVYVNNVEYLAGQLLTQGGIVTRDGTEGQELKVVYTSTAVIRCSEVNGQIAVQTIEYNISYTDCEFYGMYHKTNLYELPCWLSGVTGNYLLARSSNYSVPVINTAKTKWEDGIIDLHLIKYSASSTPSESAVISSSDLGVDIMISDFISQIYDDGGSLKINKLTLQDIRSGAEAVETTRFDYLQDTLAFGFDGDSILASIVKSGNLRLCALTCEGPFDSNRSSLFSNYTTTMVKANFMLRFGENNITPMGSNILMSVIDVEFIYDQDEGLQRIGTLRINVWLDYVKAAPIIIAPSLTQSPKTIYYRTSNKALISGLTDVKAKTIDADSTNTLVNRGYNTTGDYGWITMSKDITQLDGRLIFANNQLLTWVMWPTNIQVIKKESFDNCRNLRVITAMPASLHYIEEYAFYQSGIESVDFSNCNGLSIEWCGFALCLNLKSVNCPKGKWECLSLTFAWCTNLATIRPQLNLTLIHVGDKAFIGCSSLTTNILKYVLYGIGMQAFAGCTSLQQISLLGASTRWWVPDVESAYDYADVVIKKWAFENCTSLKTIYIEGENYAVTRWADGFAAQTFLNCKNVEAIYCNSTNPPYLGAKNIWKAGAINPRTCLLYIPEGRTSAYNSKAQWGDFPLENIHEISQEEFEEVRNSL